MPDVGFEQADHHEKSSKARRRPFTIHFDYRLTANTSLGDEAYLQQKLLPSTAAVLRKHIQARGFRTAKCMLFLYLELLGSKFLVLWSFGIIRSQNIWQQY
jgi:hypothetical protein